MFRLLFATVGVAFLLSSCVAGNAERDDKRAAKIVAEIRNPKSKNVLVICHRGDWRNYPENSIPAIESVIKMGADIVELDIAITSDSVLVLQHDRTIDRCTTGKGKIIDMTYEEIQKYYLKNAHGARNSLDLKVPTLREALEVCKDRIVVNIDKGYDHYDMVLAIAEEMGVAEPTFVRRWRATRRTCSICQSSLHQTLRALLCSRSMRLMLSHSSHTRFAGAR